ncbi:MAG: acetylglutamate kinase, partial [Lentisphaeria bacterium]|nr:acetylglutamate kinase [Lentisphaeria bacterium]
PEINETMARLGKEAVFVDGLRVTDKETVDIVQMVLAGKVNKTLVNLLEMKGGKAMGISGMDGRLIEATVKDERLGYVGKITKINIKPVEDLLERGYIPVISTLGCDREGNAYNITGIRTRTVPAKTSPPAAFAARSSTRMKTSGNLKNFIKNKVITP